MRTDRFQTLIDHCRTKPGFTKFNFNYVAKQIDEPKYVGTPASCGTCGCLMGEMAHCWPQVFSLEYCGNSRSPAGALLVNPDVELQIDSKRWYTPTEVSVATAAAWFEIPFQDAMWLFMAYEDHDELGLNYLSSDATLEQVLQNLERYIKVKCPHQADTTSSS